MRWPLRTVPFALSRSTKIHEPFTGRISACRREVPLSDSRIWSEDRPISVGSLNAWYVRPLSGPWRTCSVDTATAPENHKRLDECQRRTRTSAGRRHRGKKTICAPTRLLGQPQEIIRRASVHVNSRTITHRRACERCESRQLVLRLGASGPPQVPFESVG